MATIYIDPDVAGPGAGTEADPFKAWSSVTWTAGNTYVQAAGTQFTTDHLIDPSANNIVVSGASFDGTNQTSTQYFKLDGQTGVTIDSFALANTCASAAGTGFAIRSTDGSGNITVSNGSITNATGTGGGQGVNFVCNGSNDHSGSSVSNVTFDGSDTNDFRLTLSTGQTGVFNNISVTDCTSTNCEAAAFRIFYGTASEQKSGPRRSDGIRYRGIYASDADGAYLSMVGADNVSMTWSTGVNCGANTTNTNAIQCNGCDDALITDNVIVDVLGTDTGDGHGIIVDWGDSGDTDTSSNRATVLRSKVTRADKHTGAKGFHAYRSIDSTFVGNVAIDCSYGLGIDGTTSTGNTFYQNTVSGVQGMRAENVAAASTVRNCIMSLSGDYAIVVANAGSNTPTFTNSCAFGWTGTEGMDVLGTPTALDASVITTDPQFISTTDYRLEYASPCVGTGTRWWGTDLPPQGEDGLRFPIRMPAGGESGTLGSELVSNGTDFTGGPPPTGWTEFSGTDFTEASGRLRGTLGEGGQIGAGYTSVTTTIGNMYRLQISGFEGTSGGWGVAVTDSTGTVVAVDGNGDDVDYTFTADGSVNVMFVANDTTTLVFLRHGSTTFGQYTEYDDVSVKEWTNTTAASGPEMGAYAVRPGEDGATRTAGVLPASILEAGVDIAKVKPI